MQRGSLMLDKKTQVWFFRYYDSSQRKVVRLGKKPELSRTAAWLKADSIRAEINKPKATSITVSELWKHYQQEKMTTRFSTAKAYRSWMKNHVLPKWGSSPITDLQARPVELWLNDLGLSPKSRVHIRGLVRTLWEYAFWRGDVPTSRNPMELVKIRGASKRLRQPRSLTAEEFQKLMEYLPQPFGTIALVCVCLGLRISECLALKWSDIDWLNAQLQIARGIVQQNVDEVKTKNSAKTMSLDQDMLKTLAAWRHTTQFSDGADWVFASPIQLGALPWSYPWVWKQFQSAAASAGIGKIGTHTMRHTYRSWLDAVGTSLSVQQKLMRHASITTTMNVYGDVVTDEMELATSKVAKLAIRQ